MGISKEQIVECAEQLEADGINPSMAAVRERLGGGSFATISPVLRDWRENKASTTVAILEMPLDVKSALERFGADLWKSASSLATTQFEKLKEDSQSSIEAANNERDEVLSEIERLELALTESSLQFDRSEEECLNAKAILEEEVKKNIALEQRNDDLQEIIASLRNDLKESKIDAREASGKLDNLREEQASLSRTNGELSAHIKAGEKELLAVSGQKDDLKAELDRLNSHVLEVEQAKTKAESDKDNAIVQVNQVTAKLDNLREEQVLLSRTNGELSVRIDEHEKELHTVSEQRDELQKEVNKLKKQK